MQLSVRELAAACGAMIHPGRSGGDAVVVDGATFDSRAIVPGQLFVPVMAERDGHGFVGAAIDAGAAAYLTSRGAIDDRVPALAVPDTAVALMALARLARGRLGDLVVGITGSVGKTTVKDLAAGVLAARFRTTANPKSFNNELGLPTTLLGAPDGTEATVVEMGMRGFGEIARLCDVAQPTIGVVTIIGEAHTGRVGGVEGVARAKGELVEALPPGGTAVLYADQPLCWQLRARTAAGVVGFGETSGDVRAEGIVLDGEGRPRFRLTGGWGTVELALPVAGRHNAVNAAAAAAVGLVAGVALADVAEALEAARVSPWRMERRRAASGALVLNDAYNANPTSMRAALDTLAACDAGAGTVGVGGGRRIAVLGPMAELDDVTASHRAMAAHAASLGIELVAVGTSEYGVTPVPVAAGADLGAIVATAVGSLGRGDVVLVKGSRVAGLERVADALAPPPA